MEDPRVVKALLLLALLAVMAVAWIAFCVFIIRKLMKSEKIKKLTWKQILLRIYVFCALCNIIGGGFFAFESATGITEVLIIMGKAALAYFVLFPLGCFIVYAIIMMATAPAKSHCPNCIHYRKGGLFTSTGCYKGLEMDTGTCSAYEEEKDDDEIEDD